MARRPAGADGRQGGVDVPRRVPHEMRQRSPMKRVFVRIALALTLAVGLLAAVVAVLNFRDEERIPDTVAPFAPTTEQIARGEYLARAGNCISCHTARGGVPYAGGR